LALSHLSVANVVGIHEGGHVSIRSCTFFGSVTAVSGIIARSVNGTYHATPRDFAWGLPTWQSGAALNAWGTPFMVVQLPPRTFQVGTIYSAGSAMASTLALDSAQTYANLCLAAGLRPMVGGWTGNGAPGYCQKWQCLQAGSAHQSSCDGSAGSCFSWLQPTGWQDSLTLSPCGPAACGWGSDGGAINSRPNGVSFGGNVLNYIRTFYQPLHPVCGRELT
jgi:hypothetical protein